MATATTNTPISHADDAGFRAWGSELSGMLADVGLVQTDDTGQIDWTTATRPGTNTAAGYEIWEWSDSLQDTAPVVMKIEYGTSSASASFPQLWITVGTSSDGTGGITGASTSRTTINAGRNTSNVSPSAGNHQSYACHTDGFFGLIHKAGVSGDRINAGVFISRPLDSSGVLTNEGICVTVPGYDGTNAAASVSVDFGNSVQYPLDGSWSRDTAMVPMGIAASLVGSDFQVFRMSAAFRRIRTLAGSFVALTAEVARGAIVDVALEGSTTASYLCLGAWAPYATNQSVAGYSHAMLWQ